ncbi:MAG: DNA gyrase subunit A [Anaerolineae bacterium]|nr:DNA gyrase subunit A [Anaerolineae bacterium]MDW8069841.1 DNA gyrase subunit A [Anaerolineae bacterium]
MNVRTIPAASDLAQSYFRYATYTVLDRALPDVRDGLKPVQRRILYAMYDMGLHPNAPYKKSARIVGEVLGKYHPHGDASVYEALARMAQSFSLLHPLVDGQGNFGSVDGDSPAAMRYTEARLAPITEEMLADIRRDTVDWMPNFDGSLLEPELLPSALPNLLINGAAGIAVGMATNIPPHNLGEVCDAVVLVVERWQQRDRITVDDLMTAIKGPDFPTGGIVYRYGNHNEDGRPVDLIRRAYETGRGPIPVQGRVDIEDIGGGKYNIVITELPFDQHGAVKKGPFIEKIAQLVREGRLSGITDLRDESDHEGMRIVVEVSRAADPDKVLQDLLRYTPLRSSFGVIMLALVPNPDYAGGSIPVAESLMAAEQDETRLVSKTMPRYLNLKEMLFYFVEHRLNVIVRRSRHELAEREQRLHIVEGLLVALAHIDEVIAIIKKSRTAETAQANLMKRFQLTEVQARAILDMQLRRLAALERTHLEDERKALKQRIAYLKALLASETKQLQVIKEETLAIKEKYAQPRRTLILEREPLGSVVTTAQLVTPSGPQMVTVTSKGVLYRTAPEQAPARPSPGATTRAVESPLLCIAAGPTDALLLVSSSGKAWRGAVGRLPERVALAEFLPDASTIVGGGVLSAGKFLSLIADNARVKRTLLDDLKGSEGNWSQVMGGLNGGRLLAAAVTDGTAHMLLFTRQGKAIRFREEEVNPQASGSATGVMAMKLAAEDSIVSAAMVQPGDDWWVVVVSERGWIKRIPLAEFPVQGRGGSGVQLLKLTPTTGPVVAVTVAHTQGHVSVLSGRGRRHHFKLAELPVSNRVNRGARLVDFGDDDVIATLVAYR